MGDKAQTLNMNTYEPITLDTFRSAVRGDGMDADEDGMICELYLGENIEVFTFMLRQRKKLLLWSSRSNRLIMRLQRMWL